MTPRIVTDIEREYRLMSYAVHPAGNNCGPRAREVAPAATICRLILATVLLLTSALAHAADFKFQDLQGKSHKLSDYRGKWALVNFWATWCPPCLNEIPELISLHEAHKDKDLVVIGIAMQSGKAEDVKVFVKEHGMNYPVVLGDFNLSGQIGTVDVLPASYLYNPQGEQASYQAGEVTRASIETYISSK